MMSASGCVTPLPTSSLTATVHEAGCEAVSANAQQYGSGKHKKKNRGNISGPRYLKVTGFRGPRFILSQNKCYYCCE